MVSDVWELLERVPDPEVPVVSVVDLGIVRGVAVDGDRVAVTVTPTYSGCPAMHTIEEDIRAALEPHFGEVEVRTVLSPAWTTEWMSAKARAELARFGIAPPADRRLLPLVGSGIGSGVGSGVGSGRPRACPQCGSTDVERISEFGSTACKALYRCLACREPFDYFKAH